MKKFLNAVLVIAVLMSTTICAYARDLTSEEKTELSNYGIFQGDQDGNLRLEDNITKAEFTKMLIVLLGFEQNPDIEYQDIFKDVLSSHWAYKFIYMAKLSGIVNGDIDNFFHPNENITSEEAIKMIVSALGYSPNAASLGGYPNGYINVAKTIQLTKDVSLIEKELIKRKTAAILIYNALDIPLMKQTAYGETAEYTIMDGTNGTDLLTLRNNFTKNEISDVPSEKTTGVPLFNGEQYTGRILKIGNLKKSDDMITFNNSLNP